MGTTFAVEIESQIIPIAKRVNNGGIISIYFINSIAPLLPEATEVIAVNNTNQGIRTVGDIKKLIK